MALGFGYGLPFLAAKGFDGYKPLWEAAREGAKGAGATVEDEDAGTGSCLVARGSEVYNAVESPEPSLLIVPQFYKAGNLYQDVPPFVADDTTMRFTVTRDTTAMRVNEAGLIESVASGVPRIDWLGQSCPALLVEPSAQNLAFHSENWTSNWSGGSASGTTIATGATSAFLAPDGSFNAQAISPTSGNTNHIRVSNASTQIAYTSGTIYTQSAFLKAGAGDAGRYVQLTFGVGGFTQGGYANFDLQDGTVVASGGGTDANRNARIESYGNGWYRCSFTATCNTGGNGNGVIPVLITASGAGRRPSFAGTVTDVLYGWGAQLEVGSVATTYIPTTTAEVTRNADVITASGALVSGLIGQTEGTLYAEVTFAGGLKVLPSPNRQILAISNSAGADTNRVVIFVTDPPVTPANAEIRGFIQSPSGVIFNDGISGLNLTSAKIALAYKSGDYAIYVNGSVAASGTTAFTFDDTLSKINVGSRNNDINQLNDRIRAAALYTERLSNEQLEQLTRL